MTTDFLPSQHPVSPSAESEESLPSPPKRFIRPYPRPAGSKLGRRPTPFERIRRKEIRHHQGNPWWPFKDAEEYKLARWLLESVGQNKMDEFFKLSVVCLDFRTYLRREIYQILITFSTRSRSELSCLTGTVITSCARLARSELSRRRGSKRLLQSQATGSGLMGRRWSNTSSCGDGTQLTAYAS